MRLWEYYDIVWLSLIFLKLLLISDIQALNKHYSAQLTGHQSSTHLFFGLSNRFNFFLLLQHFAISIEGF